MPARLEIEIGGSDKGGAAELQKTLGLLEELVALKKDLSVDLFKAETVDEIKLVGEMLTATNISIDKYINLASKATNVWKDNQTQSILDGLNTKMAVLTTNANLFGGSISNTQAQVRAYQSALDALVKNGLDPTDDKLKSVIGRLDETTRALNTQKNAAAVTTVYSNLSTKLKQLETNVVKLSDAKAMGRSQISAYQKAIDDLIKLGVDPASQEIQGFIGQIQSLQAQMMNSTGAKNLNARLEQTGALITDTQNRIRQLEYYLSMARSEKSIEKLNGKLKEAQGELARLRTIGTGAADSLNKMAGGTNSASIELARIVQDAPYAAQNLGSVTNNITRLAELLPNFTARIRENLVATGQATTGWNILKGTLAASFTGWNGIIMVISLATTAMTIWQQRQQAAQRELKKTTDAITEKKQALEAYVRAMDASLKVEATAVDIYGQEIQKLDSLYYVLTQNTFSRDQQRQALEELNKIYPETFANHTQDAFLTGQAAASYDRLRESILQAAMAQAASNLSVESAQDAVKNEVAKRQQIRKTAEEQENLNKMIRVKNFLEAEGSKYEGRTIKIGKEIYEIRKDNSGMITRLGGLINEQRRAVVESTNQEYRFKTAVEESTKQMQEYNEVALENVVVTEKQSGVIYDIQQRMDELSKKRPFLKTVEEVRQVDAEIARLKKQLEDISPTVKKASTSIKAAAKTLGDEISRIYTSEVDAGNLLGLDGLDRQIQQVDNKYNKLLLDLQAEEAKWTKTYNEQARRKIITEEQRALKIREVTAQSAQERLEIEKGHFNEVLKVTEQFTQEYGTKLVELENRAGRTRTQSRERDLQDDKNYWDAKEVELKKYGYTQEQWETWRRESADNINRKWDAKDFDDTIAYQRRLSESLGQILLRRLNQETELKVAAARGDKDKLLKIQEEYNEKVRKIRAEELKQGIDLAFDGGRLSTEIAKVSAELTLLTDNFKAGRISVEEYKDSFSFLDTQRQALESLQGTVEGLYANLGNLVGDIFFDTDNTLKNLTASFKNLAKSAVSELAKIGIRYAINAAIGKSAMASTTAASLVAAKTTAAGWATAAAMVSAATFGANAIAGGAALASLVASSNLLAMTGFSSGGYTGNIGRREIAGVVHGQEFVVNAAATRNNLDLLKAMNSGQDISKFLPSSPKNANFGKPRTGNQQIVKVEVDGRIDNTQISLSNSRGKRFERKFGRN